MTLLCGHPLITLLLCLLKKHVHNNSIIIRSRVSKERYEHIHPDPKILCTCSVTKVQGQVPEHYSVLNEEAVLNLHGYI